MIVVDIESTGTEPHKHSLLSIGAIDFDNPTNQFYEECRMWEGAHVMDEALVVNGFSRESIIDLKKQTEKELVGHFLNWVGGCKERTLAGQNPSSDRDFIKYACERAGLNWPLAYRVVDLHSICYFHHVEHGKRVPLKHNHTNLNLEAILNYVGIPESQPKPHNGLTDAILEAECFSRLFFKKPMFEQFRRYPVMVQ